jgi:hypothetical protein
MKIVNNGLFSQILKCFKFYSLYFSPTFKYEKTKRREKKYGKISSSIHNQRENGTVTI